MSFRSASLKIIATAALITTALVYWSDEGRANRPTTADPTDLAIVTITSPREVSLLQLRGLSGDGVALFRVDGACYRMAVRFVAGDFDGESIEMTRSGPIRLRITDPLTARTLYEGYDLVSDMVAVGADPTAQDVDILVDGLPVETGFVINAGGGLLADIFGVSAEPVSCRSLEEADASTL